MIWNYRERLFLGVVFIVLTNVFAVWAPSMIGEGVNALNDANRDFLVPLNKGVPFQELASQHIRMPENLKTLSSTLGMELDIQKAPTSREDILHAVMDRLDAGTTLPFGLFYQRGVLIPNKTNGDRNESLGRI